MTMTTNEGTNEMTIETIKVTFKRCTVCRQDKLRNNFHQNATAKDGLESRCKDCRKDYTAATADRNRERTARWREANPHYHTSKAGRCQKPGCLACPWVGGITSIGLGYATCSAHGPANWDQRERGGLGHELCGCNPCSLDRRTDLLWSTGYFAATPNDRWTDGYLYVTTSTDGSGQPFTKVGVGAAKRVDQHIACGAEVKALVKGPKLLVYQAEQEALLATFDEDLLVTPVSPYGMEIGPKSTEVRHIACLDLFLDRADRLKSDVDRYLAGDPAIKEKALRQLAKRATQLGLETL